MSFSWTWVGAILRKELRDYRRNRFVLGTMAAVPVLFIILPTIQLVAADVTDKSLSLRIGLSLLYMLAIPVTMPSVVCAYAVVGEREQGTLEPVLTTPIRREEFLVAKALAAFVPTLVIAYLVFGVFLAIAALFAHPVIVSAVFTGSHLLVQFLFTPLLAGWAIWVGIAVSTRSKDVRVAQQLSMLGSVPPLIIVALMSLHVISESISLAVGLAAALLAFDLLAWRVVAGMFDRERLVLGSSG
jgi:ABC-type transport system involved in multi-copper enzyme maturation permease subunit